LGETARGVQHFWQQKHTTNEIRLPVLTISLYQHKILLYVFHVRTLHNVQQSHEVVGSIPDGVTGFFHLQNTSGRTMDSASKKNVYQQYFLGVKEAGE
jgi:hypothetical protein